jgi:hypothetical protein
MNRQPTEDPCEAALALLERSNQEFREHRIWKQLGHPPEKVFEVMQKLRTSGMLPKDFDARLERQRRAIRTRSSEKFNRPAPQMDGLRA